MTNPAFPPLEITPDLVEAAQASKAWPFEEARKLVKRYEKGNWPEAVTFETGYGPSGLPHIGTFGEVARTSMVITAFRLLTEDKVPVRLICFSDDMDGMRKVPGNVPNAEMLAAHLGKPLTQVPDPFSNEHESFGHHNNAKLREFLDTFGFTYEFASATDEYTSGRFDDALRAAARNYDAIMEIMLPTLGEERRATYSPFLPISQKTGQVLYVPMISVDAEAGTLTFHGRRRRKSHSPSSAAWRSCSGSRISACAGSRSASISRCMARTIRTIQRSTTASAARSVGAHRSISSMNYFSTRTGRRFPKPPATASRSKTGCAMRRPRAWRCSCSPSRALRSAFTST